MSSHPFRPHNRTAPAAALGALAPLLPFLFGISGCGGSGDRPARPNVLLISVDTLRADHLSCYGYERRTSPAIDALARDGVLFDEAYSTTSWTLPAHLSMLTGLAISAHGASDDRLWSIAPERLPPAPLRGTFLSEVLSEAGYATAGVVSWKYLEPRFGFGPGFDLYERVGHSVYSHPEWSERFQALRAAGDREALEQWMEAEPELFDGQRPTTGEAVDRALVWLDQQAADEEQPWFLFLHVFDVHDDYVPPPPFDTRFDPDYDGPITGRNVTSPNSPVHGGMAARDLEHLIALYDGEIAWVDSQLERVFDWLEEQDLADDTLVVLTSDHGEEFFEHGHKTHRRQLHRESVHVPLILRWPDELPAGVRVGGPVGLVDVAPTIYSLLDLAAPRELSGVDLSPFARGERNPEREYLSELFVFPDGAGPVELHLGLRRGAEDTLVVRSAGGAFSVRTNDRATNPNGAGPGTEVDAAGPAGAALSERIQALRVDLRRQRDAAPPMLLELRPLTATEREELAAMGYTESGDADANAAATSERDRLTLDGGPWLD